jgi:galactokinase
VPVEAVPAGSVRAFAPGRVNLIGEHTDYNGGLALPFAIAEGVTVLGRAEAGVGGRTRAGSDGGGGPARIEAIALDLGERDEFTVGDSAPGEGWRAFVRGAAGELGREGWVLPPAVLEIGGDLPRGVGLSSSAALEVALCMALLELALEPRPPRPGPIELARLCARVENDWAGAQTGLLDQLASLCGERDHAVLIDFRAPETELVPLHLGGWRLVVLDSGQRHRLAASGYNTRRAESARACELLGIEYLSEADEEALAGLPEDLRRRALHVLGEDARVVAAAAALRRGELEPLGPLLDASHASLRDLYEVSTPAVDAAAAFLRERGAAGARMIGGGFGGSVLGLFAPAVEPPPESRNVGPAAGARLLAGGDCDG